MEIGLHPRQMTALQSPANEILYGGAAGGGKSYLMRVAAMAWCKAIPYLQVYIFRRIKGDLEKNHVEGPKGFRAMLADEPGVQIVEDEIRFPNGAKIYLCHCKDRKDVYKYQGSEIHVLLIDELTHFEESMYTFLRNRVRMVGIDLHPSLKGLFPRILCGTNPGNIGHLWVKNTFIDGVIPEEIREMEDEEGGMQRQYIPAQLDDNPTMEQDDPGYEKRLLGLGNEALVRAMRYGDWNIIEGAFFHDFKSHRHVIEPFEVPSDWLRFRSFDWGYAKPFSVGWWAVVQDDLWLETEKTWLVRGGLVRYREWYGCTGKPDTGLRLDIEEIGAGILERERGEDISYGVADPGIWQHQGGATNAEVLSGMGISFYRADNTRVGQRGSISGWNHVRHRLRGTDDGYPLIHFFNTCRDSIRTVPALQHDPDRPEDLLTNMEDHAADEIRYACASRPMTNAVKVEKAPDNLVYEVQPDGLITANMSIRDIVANEAKKRKRILH